MSFVLDTAAKRKEAEEAKKQDERNVPVTQQEEFIADLHDHSAMNLAKLKDLQFLVGVNTGDRNELGILGSTIRGPYNYIEMIEHVGRTFQDYQHHAKAFVLTKEEKQPVLFLDEGTIDYIEAHWDDIITSDMLETAIFGDEFSLEPGFISDVEQEEGLRDTNDDV